MDTNVAVVANGKTQQAGIGCILATIEKLEDIRAKMTMLVDDQGLIVEEYRRHLSPSGQPGAGDAFFKWLWDNQANPRHCRRIIITPTNDKRGFAEFPESSELDKFHNDDRKFVAVALASEQEPPIRSIPLPGANEIGKTTWPSPTTNASARRWKRCARGSARLSNAK
ncbi:hypothetical protein HUU40_30070 [candidate division KSB1 bacterium]|nr:hypothetical protein [candidate division KSB1 bacterium]